MTTTRITPNTAAGIESDTLALDAATSPRELRPLVSEFFTSLEAEPYAGLWTGEPHWFAGLCEDINGAFLNYLAGHDITGTLRHGFATDACDAPAGFPHSVAVIDGYVYDFTYRQIDPEAALPVIAPLSEWRTAWDLV